MSLKSKLAAFRYCTLAGVAAFVRAVADLYEAEAAAERPTLVPEGNRRQVSSADLHRATTKR